MVTNLIIVINHNIMLFLVFSKKKENGSNIYALSFYSSETILDRFKLYVQIVTGLYYVNWILYDLWFGFFLHYLGSIFEILSVLKND